MQKAPTIALVAFAIAAIIYLMFQQWRHNQRLSAEAKRQQRLQQVIPAIFLLTLIVVGLATLARVNGIILLVAGILVMGLLFGFPALLFYRHSHGESDYQKRSIIVYSMCFAVFALSVTMLFIWLQLFGLL